MKGNVSYMQEFYVCYKINEKVAMFVYCRRNYVTVSKKKEYYMHIDFNEITVQGKPIYYNKYKHLHDTVRGDAMLFYKKWECYEYSALNPKMYSVLIKQTNKLKKIYPYFSEIKKEKDKLIFLNNKYISKLFYP